MRCSNFLALSALPLAITAALGGCVQNRPARNGVFNENEYVRKDFLVRPGDGSQPDNGWILRASIIKVSTPNPLGGEFLIAPGLENGGRLVRFVVTQDKLNMVSLQDLSNVPSPSRTEEILDAWPATNVDLKYRVNLDGETTNFYEENQELDWQQRQWVKLNFAKNDMSDLAPLGTFVYEIVRKCTEADPNGSATLVPDSFRVDTASDYMEWTTSVTVPLRFDDPTCLYAYGALGLNAQRIGRQDVTIQINYSMVRAKELDPTGYKTMVVAEKDPIRHKYGFFETTTLARDDHTGLLASRQLVNRFDPEKPIVFYFSETVPSDYKHFFLDPGGVKDQTNQLLGEAGVKARIDFKNNTDDLAPGQPPRHYGDARYNFVTWLNERDAQNSYAGLTNLVTDPRTGETLSASIVLNDFPIEDYYEQRLDAYLVSLGASLGVNAPTGNSWPDAGPCTDGDTMPIVPVTAETNHARSPVYQKLQALLGKPESVYGRIAPTSFIVPHDKDDFFRAYYALIPYQVSADPDRNKFVTVSGGAGPDLITSHWQRMQAEAGFQALAARIDHGEDPYVTSTGPDGVKNATAFLGQLRDATRAHRAYGYTRSFAQDGVRQRMDPADAFSFEQIAARDARHCINGRWETKQDWIVHLISTYWQQVIWHELGHALGLRHNFMGSLDQSNFSKYKDGAGRDHYALYSSSIMEYNAAPDHVFAHAGWGAYDAAAIEWIYGNTRNDQSDPSTTSVSGQTSKTSPWKDPRGFREGGSEIQFLFCSDEHVRYTPLCRPGDLGVTPSAIMANDIETYEWQYQWNNFREYRKVWDESPYANVPGTMIPDMRRFLSTWKYDWDAATLGTTLRSVGVHNPDANGSDEQYFAGLVGAFTAEMSAANQLAAAFHQSLVELADADRPYRSTFDRYYGDVTRQGIILDKLFAMQGFTALWPNDDFDPNEQGAHLAYYSNVPEPAYGAVAAGAIASIVGQSHDAYPWFMPLGVAQFAADTHSPEFPGAATVRDWIGGHVFGRAEDFLAFFRGLAVQAGSCATIASCTFDPTVVSDEHGELTGPDGRGWIWSYIPDRNQWVAVDKARNVATYAIARDYNDTQSTSRGAEIAEPRMKFFLDSYAEYN